MNRLNLTYALLVLLFLGLIACDSDQDGDAITTPNPISTDADLNAALNDIYTEAEAAGFAVSILKNGNVLYQNSFGKADIAANASFSNQHTLTIGSISKTFVAAAVVKAIEQGYFDLETPINDILPVALINPKKPDGVIRVKHLVTHTSGLLDQNETYNGAYHILPGEDLSTPGAQFLQEALGTVQRESMGLGAFLENYYLPEGDAYSLDNFANAAPGTSWNYSNIATSLSAFLVEIASGMDFNEYVKLHILQPLNMSNTSYDPADLNQATRAKLYWEKDLPLPAYYNDSYPDGSINTSNEDLSKFLADMMKGIKGQSSTLFAKEYYDLMFEALLPTGMLPQGPNFTHSVFWFLDQGEISHDGSDPGTTCDLRFDETGTLGFIFLANMDASTDEHEEAYYELIGKVYQALAEFYENN